MHLAVIFENIGGYHAARLRSAQREFARVSAIQITGTQTEHRWGDLDSEETPFEILTVGSDPGRLDRRAALWDILEKLGPDVVAIPGWGFDYARTALSWCRSHRATAILMSESKRDDDRRVWWKEWLKSRLYVGRFDAAIVGAVAHRDYLVDLGLPSGKIFFGYDVVDNDYFATAARRARHDPAAARARQPAIPARPFFLAVTRFIPRKNVARLIASYAAYREESSWDLVICGSGVEEPHLRALIAERHLAGAVHLPGFVSYREITDWYGLASGFIHPALHEQWGLVVNEAMAASLPVLVSKNCGCFPELVSPAGVGFDPRSEREISEALARVSHPSFDREAAGAAAFAQAQKYRPEAFGRGLLSAVQAATNAL